jgi:hypothetical protein
VALPFEVPTYESLSWRRIMDTSLKSPEDIQTQQDAPAFEGSSYLVSAHSIVVLSTRAFDPATGMI